MNSVAHIGRGYALQLLDVCPNLFVCVFGQQYIGQLSVQYRFCGPYGVMLFLKKGYSALFHHAQYRNPPGDPRTQPLGLKLEDTHSDPGIHELGLELLHRWSGAVGRGLQSEDAVVFFARSCGSVRNKQPLHTGDHAPVAPTPVGRLFPPGQGGYRPLRDKDVELEVLVYISDYTLSFSKLSL